MPQCCKSHVAAHIVTGQCDKYQDLIYWQRRLRRACTFVQTRLRLRHSTEISCAGSTCDLCTVYMDSEGCGESALANTAYLCNHQCVVSMRHKCSQYVVIKSSIKLLLVYQEKQDSKVALNRSPELYLLKAGHVPGDTVGRATFGPRGII